MARKNGSVELRGVPTIGAAIHAMGGLRWSDDFIPSGTVTIRSNRNEDCKYYARCKLHFLQTLQEIEWFPLQKNDHIVVQFKIVEKRSS